MRLSRRGVVLGAAALAGCAIQPRLPDVSRLYRYLPEVDPAMRRPLVTIPGMLGSRLRVGTDGPFAWGGPNRLSLDGTDPEAARLLALPFADDAAVPLDRLETRLRPDGVMRRANARLLGGTVEEIVYDGLVEALNAGGYEFSRTEAEEAARRGNNPGSLEFPYDWRRDIVEAARALDAFVERKAVQVERVRHERYGRAPAAAGMRFDFVAHSMGCLVLRYWLMYGAQDLPADGGMPELTWAGARRAACAIFVAPPNLGSVSAFSSLLTGRDFGFLQPRYRPGLLGTHPSVYQLMARARHNRVRGGGPDGAPVGDIYDPDLWERNGWGVLDPREDETLAVLMPGTASAAERRDRARPHLARMLGRAAQLHRALDVGGTPPAADLFLVVGTGLDTPASIWLDRDGRRIAGTGLEEGDGVVLRASALSDERQGGNAGPGPRRPIRYRTVLLLPGEHVDLTRSPVFSDNLLHWLLDAPRARFSAREAAVPGKI